MFERILVATDGSELSEKAVSSAIDLAAQHRAELVALTVVPRQAQNYFDGVSVYAQEEIIRAEAISVQHAQGALHALVARAEASDVHLMTDTVVSDMISEAIVAAANKHHSDLIVMASHGRSGFARLFLGSETQHVLTQSKLPVLVVR
jgi:nucleotide-binding universal stress UspA family protein